MEVIMPRWTMKQIEKRFEKWGKENCFVAYYNNRVIGNGANTIGHEMGFTTNQIDAMIDTCDVYYELSEKHGE
jgi:hypothetical protein